MISDPSIYLLLIVGFYQMVLPLFLYVLRVHWCFNNIPIGNTVYLYIGTGVVRTMHYRHNSIEYIFMDHGDEETQVQLESLNETRVGGHWIIKTL